MEDLHADFRPDAVPADSAETPMSTAASDPVDERAVVEQPALRPFRGPGLWGTSAWMVAFLMIQLSASLVVMIGMAASFFLNTDVAAITEADMLRHLDDMLNDPTYMVALICGTLGLSAVVNSLLIWWRLGKSGRATLGLQRLPIAQAACIMLMVLPLSLIGSKLFMAGESYWEELLVHLPVEVDLSALSSMDAISVMANELSLPWMIVIFAVLPAVSEELMFRGFIGRGLTERWGRVMGVVLTTGFFAMMHGYPPHMLALVPLSIMIHDVYLVTKSFWAPVLMHFTNNALAVTVLALHVDDPVFNANNDVAISPAMLFASVSCVLALAALIRALQRPSLPPTASAIGDWERAEGEGRIAAMQNHVSLQLDALTQSAMHHLRVKRLVALATISVMLFGIACYTVAAV